MTPDPVLPSTWFAGYAQPVLGDPFAYHGPVPDASTALLVRSDRERPAIAWRTPVLPKRRAHAADPVRLVWLFGLDVAPTRHRFTLHVDDEPMVTFTNPDAPTLAAWTVAGERGVRLDFRPTLIDRHGDLMGFACLQLPPDLAPGGRALTLKVTGEAGQSPVWFMTFQHSLTPAATLERGASLVPTAGGRRRRLHLNVTHLGEPGPLVITTPDGGRHTAILVFGHNRVPVDTAPDPGDIRLTLTRPDRSAETLSVAAAPVRPWTVDLVQHTHTDIGYTRPQSEILPEHLRFLDHALDCCDRTDHLPEAARFRWTCEALWPVARWVRARPASQLDRLRRRVAEGRIALTALPFNLSELADEAVLQAMLEPLGEFAARGLPVRLAMQDDVNGVAWSLADLLPPLGVRYLVMGQHDHRALVCFERPTAFWWESPAGSRLLAFRADHYMTGNTLGVHAGDPATFEAALLG
ncbi:MAG: hypothetical protein R3D98_06075 [Candidatus Krumholzibacteriia bacterium]